MKKLSKISLMGAALQKQADFGSILRSVNRFNPVALGASHAAKLFNKNPKPYESPVAPHPSAQVPTPTQPSWGFKMDDFLDELRNTKIGIGNYGKDRNKPRLPIFGR